jgi:hypothetical protein
MTANTTMARIEDLSLLGRNRYEDEVTSYTTPNPFLGEVSWGLVTKRSMICGRFGRLFLYITGSEWRASTQAEYVLRAF